jgi:Uma2 family endonuclease
MRMMTEVAVDRWRWSVDSYDQAVAAGVFGPEPRVELLDGEVFEVPPMLPGHAATITRLINLLTDQLDRAEWNVRSQLPVRLDDSSEPEPDVCVVRGPASRYDNRHPEASDLALVIEVSDTTLGFDRRVKLPRYGASAVPEVWIVSLPEHAIHRFTDPRPAGRTYGANEVFEPGSRVRATAVPLEVPVDSILL